MPTWRHSGTDSRNSGGRRAVATFGSTLAGRRRCGVEATIREGAHHTGTRRRSRPNGAHRGCLGQVNSAGRDVAEYNLERKRTSSTSSAGLPKRRAVDTYPRYGWARPGHACLWADLLNSLLTWPAMPKKAKSKAKSKAKLNLKKSNEGRRAAPPKGRKVAVSIPALEAAATEAADFAAKHEAAAAESKGAAEQRRSDTDAARQEMAKLEAA